MLLEGRNRWFAEIKIIDEREEFRRGLRRHLSRNWSGATMYCCVTIIAVLYRVANPRVLIGYLKCAPVKVVIF